MPDGADQALPVARGTGASAVDPLARRSQGLFRLFGLYLHWYFWRRFHAVRVSRSGMPNAPASAPLIIYSNHPSWWDPALYILLCNRLFPGRAGFGPMDAAALGKYGVLERMGVFGVEQDTPRGATRFLEVCQRVLATPMSILWITAEGSFTDPRLRPIRLRPGLAHLARRIPGATILPLAIEYTFWNESRPGGAGAVRGADRDRAGTDDGGVDGASGAGADADDGRADGGECAAECGAVPSARAGWVRDRGDL